MKKFLKIIGVFVILSALIGIASNDNDCYAKNSSGHWETAFAKSSAEERVLSYARYEGATASASVSNVDGDVITLLVKLTASNGFGVKSRTFFEVEVLMSCDSTTILSVVKK